MSEVEMKMPERGAIEAYISGGGFICLKQEDSSENGSRIVMMLPCDIPKIAEWLQRLAGNLS